MHIRLSYIYSLILLLIGMLFLSQKSLAQEKKKYTPIPKVESKNGFQKKTKRVDPSKKIFDLINQANQLAEKTPEKALDYVENALELSFKLKNKRGEGYSYNSLGAINYQLDRYGIAIENYQKAINIFQALGDEQGLYNSYKHQAMAYDASGNSDKALEHYVVFLEKAKIAGNTDDMIEAENQIARIYFNQGKYDLALERYRTVVEKEKQRNKQEGIVEAYNNMGQVYTQLNQSDQALNYYQQANEIAEKSGDKKRASQSLENISTVFRDRKEPEKELQVRQQALEGYEEVGDIKGVRSANFEIGKANLQNQKATEAIPYLKKSIDLSEDLGEIPEQTKAYEALASAYEQIGDYSNALTSYKSAISLADSIQKERDKALLATQQISGYLSQKDQRIAVLMKDQELDKERIKLLEKEQEVREAIMKRQELITYALLAGLLVVLVSGFFVLRSNRARRRSNQLLALKSLRSQMNPHFIFNSLNSINSFISKQDERSANKYLADFSKLMRAVMENSQQDFVPLNTEIQVLELYLGLEHFRFKDKFEYEFTVDPEIDRDALDIPPMLIQPYIENAIWHGLRYKEEKGFMRVSLKQEKDHLLVQVEDNGIGRERSQELKTKNQKTQTSTGLKNTAARLKIINELYQRELSVTIADRDPDAEDVGTIVKIKIPV